jgi:hypothetical protein
MRFQVVVQSPSLPLEKHPRHNPHTTTSNTRVDEQISPCDVISCMPMVWCVCWCWGAAILLLLGGRTMVRPPSGPTALATIKPTLSLKIYTMSLADLGPAAPPIASQQCGAADDARGLLVGNQKLTNQCGFG